MSKSGVMVKPAAAGAPRSDTKKVKSLVETFPCLSEEEAALLLQQYNGSLKLALEAAINGERWKKIAKPKKSKREEKPIDVASPTDRPPRKEFNKDSKPKERPPRTDKAATNEKAAAPSATVEVKEAVVHQTDVTTTSWVKGKSMSFADMLKKQSPAAAAAVVDVPAPAPSPAAPSPKAPQEKAAPKKAATTEAPASTATAAPAPEAPQNNESGDAAATGKKPRRERKPRDAAPPAEGSSAPAAPPAATVAAAPVAEVAPARSAAAPVAQPQVAAPVPAAQPVIVKYVLELDRIKDSVSLPTHVEELALRFSANWTFSATPGRAPTPPPAQQVPVAMPPPSTQPANFAVTLNQGTRHAWPGADASGNQQQQPQRMGQQQQQQQSHWTDNHAVNAWGRPSPPAGNFTSYHSYQQAQYRPQTMNYRYNNSNQQQQHPGSHHHHHHSNRHPEQVASDLAYNAIRDEQPRFNAGVW